VSTPDTAAFIVTDFAGRDVSAHREPSIVETSCCATMVRMRRETRHRRYCSLSPSAAAPYSSPSMRFASAAESIVTGDVAGASTQNQALAALLFLYGEVLEMRLPWLSEIVRAAPRRRLPVVLSREEVRAVLEQLSGTPQLMAFLLYGAGLRLLECARLRVKDIEFSASQLIVRGRKGDKDRVTLLPAAAVNALERQIARVRRLHERDLAVGAGWVELPHALSRKYPNGGRELPWQWVFPAVRIYTDRVSGEHRRHHLHETVVQRAVHRAVRAA